MMTQAQILIVEDDQNLGYLLSDLLLSEAYQVELCTDGEAAWQALQVHQYDLCVLDVMMPNLNGFQLAQKIKTTFPELPFLFITAKTQRQDKLKGFHLGAEDYITKPFDEEELLLRIQVILRRKKNGQASPKQFKLASFQFDYDLQELRQGASLHRLTEKENEVLYQLCLHKNKILKREAAVEAIYGKQDYFLGRSFDVFISKMRKIFKEEPAIEIENVFKVGFIFHVKD
jgi:DNA-binding response OmpR family regulator